MRGEPGCSERRGIMKLTCAVGVCLVSFLPAIGLARSPAREVVGFSVTTNTGFGRSAFVVGSHDDAGAWNPVSAVKLRWTPGDVWTGAVAVQAGTVLEYKFVSRGTAPTNYCDGGNVEWAGGANLTASVPAHPDAPYTGKTITYHSGWTNAFVAYRVGTNWYAGEMSQVGAGRGPGEYLYRIAGIGEAGEALEFIPYGHYAGTQYWDHAPYGGYGDSNYYTSLDAFVLQDGNVFSYWPPASVSVSRISTTNVTSSWAPTIPSRDIRIYVPRGYDQNTWKRYPVVYMHDGQNVFQPGGTYGCWDAELTADKEISQGRMRECIIVAVDTTSERNRELCPPGDDAGEGPGTGDLYANFLIHNVRPTIDAHYRTLNDRSNTLVAGSSMGGLASAYLGLATNVFGGAGVFSPAFLISSNFMGWIYTNDTQGIRIYMDDGTENLDAELWDDTWRAYDYFLDDQYAVNEDLLMIVGCGHDHNEAAWAARLPEAFRFLLNTWDEPNLLLQDLNPPQLAVASTGNLIRLSFDSLRGRQYRMDRSPALQEASWQGVVTSGVESLPWAAFTLADTNGPAVLSNAFYRVVALPWP